MNLPPFQFLTNSLPTSVAFLSIRTAMEDSIVRRKLQENVLALIFRLALVLHVYFSKIG